MTRSSGLRLSILRVSIIGAALFSLCVSNNVGPCFLPLPALGNYAPESLQQATASRPYSRGLADFRVPMAQAQKRADRELQAQSLAVMPGIDFVLPTNARVFAELSDPQTLFTVDLASLPSGRAPPRLT